MRGATRGFGWSVEGADDARWVPREVLVVGEDQRRVVEGEAVVAERSFVSLTSREIIRLCHDEC